jgi:hypothetical protein
VQALAPISQNMLLLNTTAAATYHTIGTDALKKPVHDNAISGYSNFNLK